MGPRIDYHGFIATGDHGISLYAFERTFHGEIPGRDYLWIYGPLMPYYFAAFFKMLGVNIMSVFVGEAALTLAASLMIFLTLRTLSCSSAGFMAALWFFVFEHSFFYTYNHAGGILAVTAILFFTARYVIKQNLSSLWAAAFTAFLLALIKINFGMIGFLMITMAALATDKTYAIPMDARKISFYIFNIIVFPSLILAIYWCLLHRLSWTELNQCLPYFGAYQPYHSSVGSAITQHLARFGESILADPLQLLFTSIVLFSLGNILYSMKKKTEQKPILSFLAVLAIYYILNFHEYLLSGLSYRGIWAEPVGIVWMFTIIGICIQRLSKVIQTVLIGAIITIAGLTEIETYHGQQVLHVPSHYLKTSRAKVFVQNDPAWIATVQATTAFLKNTLKPNETFLAFPYDPLYYYLSDRKSPTWLLNFIEMNHVPPEQERAIIRDLETNNVNLILLSNRISSHEQEVGVLGVTFCPLLADYFRKNFVPIAQFGDWAHPPGWAWNHGTVILKRNHALSISK